MKIDSTLKCRDMNQQGQKEHTKNENKTKQKNKQTNQSIQTKKCGTKNERGKWRENDLNKNK